MFKIISWTIALLVGLFWYTTVSAQTVQLRWDANTESDLVGYKLYYKTVGWTYEDPTPIEDEVPVYGASPIVLVINCDPFDNDCVNNADPTFTLEMDLSDKDYWMVLTAYDNETPENESGFSNEVTTQDPPQTTESGDRGGGSGGCFINILTGEKKNERR